MDRNSANNITSSADRQNISFKFSKIAPKTNVINKLEEDVSSSAKKDYVISVNDNEIKSSAAKEIEKDLIIPLIKKNKWRTAVPEEKGSKDCDDSENKLKQMAIEELLKESKEKNEKWDNREFKNDSISIPLVMQNKVPDGYETDERMDVSLRADESKLEDYERIPVDKFGLAMLRGMGWKEGDAIGSSNKSVVEPVQVELRPKGLGLGADASALNKRKENIKNDEKLELVKGAYIHIIQGNKKGFYGQVLGLDEENARVIVKINDNEKAITYPEFSVEVVSKKEYEKESKVINRAAFEKFKNEYEKNEKIDKRKENTTRERENYRDTKKVSKDERKRSYDDALTKEKSSREGSSKRKRNEESSVSHKYDSHKSSKSWVRPQLRVRIIDDKYKKGKYFNEKVVVMDVLSSSNCTCRTENGKYLEDISPSMLETVIPRTEPSYVMIVQGKYGGELCTILERNKSKCLATVQFLSNRDQAIQIDYDSICEYIGDVAEFD